MHDVWNTLTSSFQSKCICVPILNQDFQGKENIIIHFTRWLKIIIINLQFCIAYEKCRKHGTIINLYPDRRLRL